jgi:hypothetical protein
MVEFNYPPEAEPAAPAKPRGERETFDLVTFDREDPEPRLVLGRWILELREPGWQHIESRRRAADRPAARR